MSPWLIVASPFLLGALIVGGIKACEAFGRWRYNRAVFIRNETLKRYCITPYFGTKERPR